MEDWRGETWERAELFAAENGRTLIGQLGYGYDGNVFATERQSAIKVLRFQRIMAHFARIGIYLADVKPGNIAFAESD